MNKIAAPIFLLAFCLCLAYSNAEYDIFGFNRKANSYSNMENIFGQYAENDKYGLNRREQQLVEMFENHLNNDIRQIVHSVMTEIVRQICQGYNHVLPQREYLVELSSHKLGKRAAKDDDDDDDS